MVLFDPERHPEEFGLDRDETRLALGGLEQQLGYTTRIPEPNTIDTRKPEAAAFVALFREVSQAVDEAGYSKGVTPGYCWLNKAHAGAIRQAIVTGLDDSGEFANQNRNVRLQQHYSRERLEPIARAAQAQLAPLTNGPIRRLQASAWLRISDVVFGSSGR